MLRLDSSEMLPGSQKGEETAQILSTAIVVVALATRGSLAMKRVGTRADGRRCHVPV